MNKKQALEIRTITNFPRERVDQEEIIQKIMGYSKLRGRPLDECSDAQIYTVAKRLYEQAYQPAPRESFGASLLKQVRVDYANHLYEIFNIPEEERAETDPAELEAILLE
ncbi:MAG: hypothetical protein KKH52_03670 [Nanoarchaeota archaeon]|nr:hypothetical protein [Nanoarchaeota archaeon]MBU1622341.1 hypothetical protein [Nanoarchaeota archaeon]MBU1974466.1 hypothetical protein [Nanoarchaeota archaeon]